MDPNLISKLMKDDFDTPDPDEDFDDADLESELHGLMGGKSAAKTGRPKKQIANKPAAKAKQRPPPQNANEDEEAEDGMAAFDMNNIQNLLSNIDAVDEEDDEEIDENDPELLSELAEELEKPMPGPRQRKKAPVVPAVQEEILVKSTEPEPEPELEPEPKPFAKEQNITKVKNLQIEYKRAALKAKTNGNKNAALTYLRVSKQLDTMINSLNADEDVDMSKLPPLPKDLPIPSPEQDPTATAANVEVPAELQLNADDASKLFNAPTYAGSVMEALEQRLTKFKETKEKAVADNNSSKARRLGRIVTQMEKAIKDHKAGKPVNFDELPCPPGFPPIPVENKAGPVQKPVPPPVAPKRPASSVPLKQSDPPPVQEQPASEGGQVEAEGEIPPEYQLNADDASKLFNAPTSAGSVMEALEQRLTKFKETKDKAVVDNNSSKARRLGRIVTQMEKAIKDYKAGKLVNFDELPCPPGFPPIPVENNASAAASVPAAPKPQPASKPRPPLKKQMSTTASKQLNYLLERQRLFREAAIEAKKRGEIEQAKEYLRSCKGFDALIEATRSGLPIDATSIPTPPQLNEDFLVVSKPVDDEGDDSIPRSIFDIDRDEMYEKIAQELQQQIEMCIRNREYFLKMGDIPTSSKFEKYASDSKKDLHMLLIRKKNGDPIPSYRVEERKFSIVVANLDVPLNELHVEVVRAFDFSGTPTIDTYVRADFPFPSENPQWKRTKTFHDSLSPEYNDTLFFQIDRKSRALPRILKRHPLKLTIYAKGCVFGQYSSCFDNFNCSGFLRSDNIIGTVLVKMNDLETKCTVHECSAWTQGRKVINGRLEVKVKLREPLLAKQVEEIKEKWIVFS